MTLNDIRLKILGMDSKLVTKSSQIAFRDIFDPYCAEYAETTKEEKVFVINELSAHGVFLLALYHAFVEFFNECSRPDIADSGADGLVFLVDYLRK